jgi:predicted RNA-binding Zn-ribbon protein involved in translation (DUF1610 family)
MKPDSLEHDYMAALTPGTDEEERGLVPCPECGYETEANRAAIAIAEEYTCPECGTRSEVDNYLGLVLLVLILAIVYVKVLIAWRWLKSKLVFWRATDART